MEEIRSSPVSPMLRGRLLLAAILAVCGATTGIAPGFAAGSTDAPGDVPSTLGEPDPYVQGLDVFVKRRPTAFKRATVHASGGVEAMVTRELWVYEDLRGGTCAASPTARGPKTRSVIAALPVEGSFSEQRRLKMKRPGPHTFCAYLVSDEGTTGVGISRKVRRPLLRSGEAQRTVAVALRRHKFAGRVVANLQETCDRRSRSKFQCSFTSTFLGYRLSGSGTVVLNKRLSYRFQVSAQGQGFVLTDENEGRLPR